MTPEEGPDTVELPPEPEPGPDDPEAVAVARTLLETWGQPDGGAAFDKALEVSALRLARSVDTEADLTEALRWHADVLSALVSLARGAAPGHPDAGSR